MQPSHNPYRPPTADISRVETNALDRIALHGDVTFEDLVALIEVPWIMRVFQGVCVLAIGFFAVLVVAGVWMGRDDPQVILAVLGMFLAMSSALAAVNWLLSSRSRAKRLVKKSPGLVGPIHGYLDAYGLTCDGHAEVPDYQISWAAFGKVAVRERGIRLAWTREEACTIAIPHNCIDGYSREAVSAWVKRIRSQAVEPSTCRAIVDWATMPKGAVGFQSVVPTKPPLTHEERRRIMYYNGLQVFGYAVCVLLFFWSVDIFAIVLIALFPIAVGVIGQSEYARAAPQPYRMLMRGWITEDGVCGFLPGSHWQVFWNEAKRVRLQDETITAEFGDGSGVTIHREDLISNSLDSSEWPRLKSWVAHLAAAELEAYPTS
ncbi:hypothetical protein [Rubripirellula tenax]|nr:hypothetical protein [Rubripirellula tenax]